MTTHQVEYAPEPRHRALTQDDVDAAVEAALTKAATQTAWDIQRVRDVHATTVGLLRKQLAAKDRIRADRARLLGEIRTIACGERPGSGGPDWLGRRAKGRVKDIRKALEHFDEPSLIDEEGDE